MRIVRRRQSAKNPLQSAEITPLNLEGQKMMKQLRARLPLVALLGLGIAPMSAQTVQQAGNVSKSATIVAIDHSARTVTLKDSQGRIEDVHAGDEVKRFDELKVGDSVTFSYHAAVVYQILKPGATPPPVQGGAQTVRGQGPKPSGAVTQQHQATVTIERIDPAAPSVTVRTADGHSMSAQVEDKKNLEGLKVGDKVTVTFTEALMVTVEAPKK
jgi:Cu/Ag efflux protein CusF